MPSGHSQSCGFCLGFIYFATYNIYITLFYLFISLCTLIQRVTYKNHTILQVIIGFFIGWLFSYFVYNYGKKILKGIIKAKSDDFALL